MRAHNVPYMTGEWKNAIKAKRHFSKKFSKNPTHENFELKRKWRNVATRERRKVIRCYWNKVSDNINSDPRTFYRTFRPFTDLRNKRGNSGDICLKVNDVLEVDQFKVANHFAKFFFTMSEGIGGNHVNDSTESDFMNHNCLQSQHFH